MRDYGQIQSSYWTHPDIKLLSTDAKLIGAYLLTCQHTNGIGCFRMPVGYVSIDLDIGIERVSIGLSELYRKGFLEHDETSEYILIPNFLRWNPISNPNSAKARAKEFGSVPSGISIYQSLINALIKNGAYWGEDFLNHIKTLSKGFLNGSEGVLAGVRDNRTEPNLTEPEPNQNRTEQEPEIVSVKHPYDITQTAKSVIEYLNEKTQSRYGTAESNMKLIRARLKEGHSVEQMRAVIDRKTSEWINDQKMSQFLRPATLFNAEKFNQYVGALDKPLPAKNQSGNSSKAPDYPERQKGDLNDYV